MDEILSSEYEQTEILNAFLESWAPKLTARQEHLDESEETVELEIECSYQNDFFRQCVFLTMTFVPKGKRFFFLPLLLIPFYIFTRRFGTP